jgi:uncharacterized radical SAM superfamily Fe-S cluster-containing enzyme
MTAPVRPYLFYDTAVSICKTCFRRVDAKIVFENNCVYMLKRCALHGFERVLIADDVDYYRRCREVFITGTRPSNMDALTIADSVPIMSSTHASHCSKSPTPAI